METARVRAIQQPVPPWCQWFPQYRAERSEPGEENFCWRTRASVGDTPSQIDQTPERKDVPQCISKAVRLSQIAPAVTFGHAATDQAFKIVVVRVEHCGVGARHDLQPDFSGSTLPLLVFHDGRPAERVSSHADRRKAALTVENPIPLYDRYPRLDSPGEVETTAGTPVEKPVLRRDLADPALHCSEPTGSRQRCGKTIQPQEVRGHCFLVEEDEDPSGGCFCSQVPSESIVELMLPDCEDPERELWSRWSFSWDVPASTRMTSNL